MYPPKTVDPVVIHAVTMRHDELQVIAAGLSFAQYIKAGCMAECPTKPSMSTLITLNVMVCALPAVILHIWVIIPG